MKTKDLLLLLLFSGMFFIASSQEKHKVFTVDTLFINDLTIHFRSVGDHDKDEAGKSLSELNYLWTSNLLAPGQKQQVMEVSAELLDQKLTVAPFYIAYLNAISSLVRNNYDQKSMDVFHRSVFYCLKGKNPARNFSLYLNQVNLLVKDKAFLKSNTEGWYTREAVFTFSFDSVPSFVFSKTSLACVVRGDSACIYNTSGTFYPLIQRWYGSGGKVYWDRVGLSRDEVYASLSDYSINTKVTFYSADSVTMYHGGFIKKPLLGKLDEKVITDVVAEKALYPRFSMYPGSSVIINLFKDVEYEGGFSLEGMRVIGFPSTNNLAKIMISRHKEPFIELRSKEFVIRPDRFVSARAIAIVYFGSDSIFHPGVQVRYNLENNEIAMIRADQGLSQSPFFNSYHKIDMIPEALYWKLDSDELSFEAVRGIRSKGEALFESSDYFSAYRYDKLQGIDDVNPVNQVSIYARRHSTDRFFVEDLATYIKKPIEQVRVQMIKLANAGFLIFDIDNDFVTLKPRLTEFLASHNGVKDFDIIQFNSFVEKGSNAILDLKTMDLTIQGVQQVMLSDSQYVYVIPQDQKIILKRNRDFLFKGRVHAGFFDFYAHECSFDYDKFLINLPQVDSMVLAVPSWEVDQGGYRRLVRVKNVIADMSGVLEVDAPNSKSGRKSLQEYPRFTSKDNSFVYFDRKNIVKGVYKRDKFYYSVDPFSMDSLNRLPAENVQFKGRLISGDLLPDIDQPLCVQRDYSLGFQRVIPPPGLSLYGGKGTFSDTLRLSNNGLRGSGTLTYLSSVTHSNDFLICPDSTSGNVKDYDLARRVGQFENPDAKVKDARVKFIPGKDVMYVSNSTEDKISMFNDKASLDGDLALSPNGLRGKGLLAFEDAEVRSNTYTFNANAFTSDTADFTLYTPDHKEEALKVHVFRTEIDFTNREGHFTASGKGALMEFPVNKINCVVDEFDWLMDHRKLQLVNQTSFTREKYMQMTPEELINLDPAAERYVSTDPKQDSLRFFAMTAIYDLVTNVLQVEDARILRIADAAIFPRNGKLTIAKEGIIQELKQASVLANRTNKFHTFYNASVKVESKNSYTANGLYDYVPSDGDKQTLFMRHIAVNSKSNSYALSEITDSLEFTLNRYFGFQGKMEVHAEKKPLYFEGGYQLKHECEKITKEWIKLRAELDPKLIMIPVEGDIENTGDGKLRVSIFYSLTENTLKPGFFVKPDNVTDQDLLSANGLLTYDVAKAEYRVTNEAKHKNLTIAGNSLSLNTNRCVISGEGKMNLVGDMGRLNMTSAGRVNFSTISDSVGLNIMTALDFFFSDDALKILADDINASDLNGIDISSINYTKPLRELVGQEEADKLLTELSLYGQYRKFPEVLNYSMVLCDLNLGWNPEIRSYINQGRIGISNFGKTSVNRYVNGHVEIIKRRTGDMFSIYLEPAPDKWYFFSYSGGTMQVLSTNKEFNDKLTGLKEDQRVIKSGNGEPSYQFIISTSDKKTTFLRKMKQLKGE
ncbi:MAG: hypothetical protein IPH45_01595 [Bacteroidales bacterium]|nr:hypothetical protein [Bacteroidales bacterium]